MKHSISVNKFELLIFTHINPIFRIIMWNKILPYLKHLSFIIAIFSLVIGVDDATYNKFRWDDFAPYLGFSLIIIFFLWKNNYFKRNKS